MLFDRDEDGVLSFQELQVVIKSMGQRPSGLGLMLKVSYLLEEELLFNTQRRSNNCSFTCPPPPVLACSSLQNCSTKHNSNNYFQLYCSKVINDWQFGQFINF